MAGKDKPLTQPENYTELPQPTPGGANRADQTPLSDATIALGGNPAAGIVDGGLVNYASRFGRESTIREQLASEDLQFRRASLSGCAALASEPYPPRRKGLNQRSSPA